MYETREIDNRLPQGTPVGVNLAAGPDGKPGGSYQFAGQANSYIEFQNNGGLDAHHSITMLCWIFPENTDGPIFNYVTSNNNWGVHLWIVSPGKLFARFNDRNYQFTSSLTTSQPLTLNQWHYIGASYDHNTGIASLWLNGQQNVQQYNGAGVTLATQDDVRMGVKSGDDRYFKGRIAAMQVYDVALTAEQINAVENAGQGNLITYLKTKPPTLTKHNRPFPSYPLPLFQNESTCETIHIKMSFTCRFIFMQIKLIFI